MASPLLGYNTNVRHHGRVYHIQTEDSGTTHAHIFTHLFADGGRIIATKKTTYAQFVGTDRFPASVKKLMQAQHKAMFIALRDGLFDQDEVAGAKEFAAREITLDDEPKPEASAALDVDALERAAAGYLASGAESAPGSVPAAVPEPPRAAATPEAAAPPPKVFAPPPREAAPAAARSGSGKYQATQPVKPSASPPRAAHRTVPKQSDSVFGQDLLSEKSLDEVIMSYLAEDLDSKE